jgi:DNA-binding LytR/AlgR family response regulator
MKIKCLVVDDEPLSRRVVEKYAAELVQLDIVGSCADAFAALEILQKETVDLLLLDINMPKLSGISLLKSLPKPPLVIFITAYAEHAVEGFELEAVDYLLKPFSFERFVKAINRAGERLGPISSASEPANLIIKADKKLYQVDTEDIRYLQAYGDYVKVFTNDKTLVTKERLTNLEALLPKDGFQRIHRSYIVALSSIEFIEGNQVKIGADYLPVTVNYKEGLLLKLKKS